MKTSKAEVIREYGPFPEAEQVHGVSFDGNHVWFASGNRLNAFDPGSGKKLRSLEVRRACGHRVRRQASVPDRREPHPKDRSEDGARALHDSGARRRR
jgi:hypothetical protein